MLSNSTTFSVLLQCSKHAPRYWQEREHIGMEDGLIGRSTLQGTEQASAVQQHVLWQLCWSWVFTASKCEHPILPKAGEKP